MRRRFVTLDVFTSRRFAGNPLAVVLDAEGLETEAMQAIAREFNLAETVLVLPPQDPAHRARLRIFTPATELPFAGHPTVGTAVLLNRLDGGGARDFVLEEKIGPIPCATASIDPGRGRARFQLARLPEPLGEPAARETIAAALGLAPEEIGFDDFRPSLWSAGISFTFVPVRGLDAIRRCEPRLEHWKAAFARHERSSAYVFCRETVEAGSAFHARMFAPRLGVYEDPATGSAAAAFAGALLRFAPPGDGEHDTVIEQGFELGRPSLITLSVAVRDRRLTGAAIGGEAIAVSEGTIDA
ncbi:MAG TPA: PhzF family phenazine biosynthesis protein [Stellaceae bacterium]|nr:PhzF family phenazine biosynthesis protein [Stellaceae bacterium]